MTNATTEKQNAVELQPDDPRLVRAAHKLIKLYDLQPNALFSVRAESLAHVISAELNTPAKS